MTYLGHNLTRQMNGNSRLMKLSLVVSLTVRQIALAKVQHMFCNVHIPRKVLCEINNRTVKMTMDWFKHSLNT